MSAGRGNILIAGRAKARTGNRKRAALANISDSMGGVSPSMGFSEASQVTVREAGDPLKYGKGAPKTASVISAETVSLALRSRFNPLRQLTPHLLSNYLDQRLLGFIAYSALVWEQMECRDDVIRNVASKRKKAVSRLRRQSLQREDTPEAKAHAQALDEFYDNITVVNALDENECGGFPLLVRQMMDAVGKYYAVHEIVWEPGSLGDGGNVLTAELRFVPLWFFENRSGRLQFLKLPLGGANGLPLEPGGWMITKGDGIMEACSIAYMFKNMPLKDWIAYSDKFGTPGVMGQTNAVKGSDAGEALKAAVAQFGQNWSGVVYGADGAVKDPIKLIEARGEGTLPFPPLVERMDRAMAALWRGSDLSTMSADTKGASVQEGESDILIEDDAAMISETLNLYLDRWVIWQKFGAKPLAYSKIVVPEEKNIQMDLAIDELLLKAGARMGERERLEYYGRPVISATDTPLHNPATVTEREQTKTAPESPTEEVPNVRPRSGRDFPNATAHRVAGKLMARARDLFAEELGNDLAPLSHALSEALGADDATILDRAEALYKELPGLGPKIIAAKTSDLALYKIFSAALANGLASDSDTSA